MKADAIAVAALADVRATSIELLSAFEDEERCKVALADAKDRRRWAETNHRAATAVLRTEERRLVARGSAR